MQLKRCKKDCRQEGKLIHLEGKWLENKNPQQEDDYDEAYKELRIILIIRISIQNSKFKESVTH